MGVPTFLIGLWRQEPRKRRLVRSLALGSKAGDRTVTSADGTELSVRRTGRGVPIVCVHGSVDGIGAFALLELELAAQHAVWVYDRRGRGASGDTPPYALEREVEDLQAVVAAAGEAPHVVGHSFGACVALRAGLEGTPIRSLVLYEPPLEVAHLRRSDIARVRDHVERGELAEALRTMATAIAGVAPEEVDIALAVRPVRKRLFDAIRSTPRELEALTSASWSRHPVPLTGIPTLMLRGANTTAPVYPTPEELPRWVHGADIEVLPGQDHLAMTFAPHDVAIRVLRFVDRH